MKVYIGYIDYGLEGCSTPEFVTTSAEKALNWVQNNGYGAKIEELELDDYLEKD